MTLRRLFTISYLAMLGVLVASLSNALIQTTSASSQPSRQWPDMQIVIPTNEISRGRLLSAASDMLAYYAEHLGKNYSLTYLYDPVADQAPATNQLIRQWLAVLSVRETVRVLGDPVWEAHYPKLASRLIADYFRKTKKHAGFEWRGQMYLATNAIAAMALRPLTSKPNGFEATRADLLKTLIDSRQHDGSFITTLKKPKDTPDYVDTDFAPLAALIALVEGRKDGLIVLQDDALMQSLRFYRDAFWKAPNNYGAPWHLMAYAAIYRTTQQPEAAQASFAAADYLVNCQLSDTPLHMRSGFFNGPGCAGPADRSAMQTEALIHAYKLAKKLGEPERAARYETAIRMGLRASLQLQIRSEHEALVANMKRAKGGVRTTFEDSMVRIDNVSHALMPVLLALEHLPQYRR